MKIPTGIRKEESERRKILGKNGRWALLTAPSFQYSDSFSRLGWSFSWCCICPIYLHQRNPCLGCLSLWGPLLFWHYDFKWLPSLLMFPLHASTLLVFSHLKWARRLLLLRIWVNLRLTLLFLRHPLASYKALHFAVEKGEQFCLDEVCNHVQENALML